jgi:hypothetical protein
MFKSWEADMMMFGFGFGLLLAVGGLVVLVFVMTKR